jgi:tetratricopeptide (TPR) repeat protein
MASYYRKQFVVCFAVLFGVIFSALLGCNSKNYYIEGIRLLGENKWNEAQDRFQKVKEENPLDARAVYYLAYINQKRGSIDLAVKGYDEAIQLHQQITIAQQADRDKPSFQFKKAVPLNWELDGLFANLGNAYLSQKKWDQAIDSFTKSILLNPFYADTFFGRGSAFFSKGFLEPALNDISTAVNLSPLNVKFLCKRASLHNILHNADQCINDCLQAIKINPESAEAFHIMGMAYASQKIPQWTKAIASLEEALRLDDNGGLSEQIKSELAGTYFQQGKALFNEKNRDEAEKAFAKAENLDPAYAAIVKNFQSSSDIPPPGPEPQFEESLRKGFASLELDQYDQAIQEFTEASRINPKSAEACYGRGLVFMEKNFPDTALSDFNMAISLDRKHVGAFCQRARSHSRLGNYQSAIDDCTKAIQLDPNSDLAYYHRFYAYLKCDNYDRASADLQEAAKMGLVSARELQRAKAEIYYRRGLDFYAKREWRKALDDFTVAENLEPQYRGAILPKNAEANYRLGRALYYNGEYKSAFDKLNSAIELNGQNANYYYYRGMSSLNTNQRNEAIDDFTQAVLLDPEMRQRIPREIENKIINPKSQIVAKQPSGT